MYILRAFSVLTILILFTGCANYMISAESLVSQLRENQKIERNLYFQRFALIDYPSNNLQKIKCEDKRGNKVWLYPDKNTEFIIQKKSDGKKVKAYFDTVIFQNDTLYGLRSRLIGGLRVISVNDIKKVAIYAEIPRVEKVNE
ncbi:hypothetical protein [Xanthocytophaga flava]|uniref:hypothetical protein n=1 Tax=Xanthocytophaga flava TaxID=3048013 RepID=UPI0028D1F861|nr:hypothetical protein [Xanthocytophaga flavus]MDJ1469438.1 hypothetical protein [Xanthocytophaga flavus]